MFIQYGRYSLFGSMSSKCTIQAPIGLEDIDIEQKCIRYPVILGPFYPFNASPHRPQALLFKRWLNVMPLTLEILKKLLLYPFHRVCIREIILCPFLDALASLKTMFKIK